MGQAEEGIYHLLRESFLVKVFGSDSRILDDIMEQGSADYMLFVFISSKYCEMSNSSDIV